MIMRIKASFDINETKIRKIKRNSYQKNEEVSRRKAHTNTWKLNWNVLTITGVFLDQKRINVCEHMVNTVSHSHDAVFTICSHIFNLFWLRKISVIIKIFQISFHVFVCAFPPEISLIFLSHILCYLYFSFHMLLTLSLSFVRE